MSRRRPTWPELPEHVRVLIEDRLGASVVDWTSHDSGYSPGPALTLVTATDRVFVKAADVAAHPVTATFHRREAEVASLLPAGIPTPGIPHVRAFQRAQGGVCLDWLRVRLGG